MLDYFGVFSLGGYVLWQYEWMALKGSPIGAFIQSCIIEQRASTRQFAYAGPQSVSYTIKWEQSNQLGLVFVAIYRSVLSLSYVEDLLERVKNNFEYIHSEDKLDYDDFTPKFQEILAKVETQKDAAKPKEAPQKKPQPEKERQAEREDREAEREAEDEDEDGCVLVEKPVMDNDGGDGKDAEGDATPEAETSDGSAFNASRLKSLMKRKNAKGSKDQAGAKPKSPTKGRPGRTWGISKEEQESLDFTDKSAAAAVVAPREQVKGKSLMDEEYDKSGSGDTDAGSSSGWLNGVIKKFNKNLNVTGHAVMESEDVQPILEMLKEKLVSKNVAEEVAETICQSVESNMSGKKLQSFTRVSTAVTRAVEEALTHILSPGRNINVLQEIEASKREGEPYSIVFIGVNGVGKSTNLAKVAFWLMQHGLKVMIAACDTFRSGAVEQLRTHAQRLGVELFERGYEKDPAAVAREGLKRAKEGNFDVLLVDTAGRMQDNEPLMRALAKLINMNKPNLTLFVGEALVGNEAVDQLSKFNSRLKELSTEDPPHQIDGIVLTKFDTIDNKVGAALSMVYISGAPVIFVGCGQTYTDLRRLNVQQIVSVLLE
mmetsp:Transcript_3239/g.8016  ORF Transcript_3239/g.8016 Transcript_3239/m.8016 type:complete len:600 (-) Transcript_3239:461-2260(-)|eukprot:CAMPEP_0198237068 /NCGR_PEP_ID=MMETSP1446-20131203/2910_1 /TAXON_ID=1461542 ORGANISM="Unidentified sp, Strain CCMP2111" /NCGR_SAMPLE_ID=MMETSP1446 /ASSEMBLY_ACC=CAM_ASM_001112 /LENGTH=599 /DNA_ID=CAMNT_0043919071 /DNA_START=107 /DNA_END=1906 /DNA_ORIENTATION=-